MQLLTDICLNRAIHSPNSDAYCFFKGSKFQKDIFTFKELGDLAASLASKLQSSDLYGARVLLVCQSEKHFVVAFFACLLSGSIAVPSALPRKVHLHNRLKLLIEDSQPLGVISDSDEVLSIAEELIGNKVVKFDIRNHISSFGDVSFARGWRPPFISESSLAFLQYTSGSTGDPKGVAVTHGNLAHNCLTIQKSMDISADSIILTSLPLFHDMGLVGGVLVSMYVGCCANFLPPNEFIQYPDRWLHLLSDLNVSHSGGPNFMYDLASEVIEDEELLGIDLSSWRVAFCGAEPVRVNTIKKFSERFKPYGFTPNTFYPCYGMAESTLFVSGAVVGTFPRIEFIGNVGVVSCGKLGFETEIEIVDPLTLCKVKHGEVGEIWLHGPSIAHGYWGRKDLTLRTFHAHISGNPTKHYLRTGDLGFIQSDELFVTSRLKDILIVNGKKFSPHDLEDEAERSHSSLVPFGGAVFSVSKNESDSIFLVFELRRSWLRRPLEWQAICSVIRSAIFQSYCVRIDKIMLLKPGLLPRTSSGKVRRSQCKNDFLSGSLQFLHCG